MLLDLNNILLSAGIEEIILKESDFLFLKDVEEKKIDILCNYLHTHVGSVGKQSLFSMKIGNIFHFY